MQFVIGCRCSSGGSSTVRLGLPTPLTPGTPTAGAAAHATPQETQEYPRQSTHHQQGDRKEANSKGGLADGALHGTQHSQGEPQGNQRAPPQEDRQNQQEDAARHQQQDATDGSAGTEPGRYDRERDGQGFSRGQHDGTAQLNLARSTAGRVGLGQFTTDPDRAAVHHPCHLLDPLPRCREAA